MIKKFLAMFLVLSLILANICMTTSLAASVKVTDENLKASLEKVLNSDEKKYNVIMENNQLKITAEDVSYTINYDLTNNPTFTYEASVMQGMSYNDFQKKTSGISGIMLYCYIAVADIQGVPFEDSSSYIAMSILSSALSAASSDTSDRMMVMDDTNLPEGVSISKDSSNKNIIYASEFGDHVMEYVNSVYANKQVVEDEGGFNTFEMTTERKDVTDTSCKIVTELVVKTDGDFSQMVGLTDALTNPIKSTEYKIINGQNELMGRKLIVGLKEKNTAEDVKNNISLADIYIKENCTLRLFNVNDKELVDDDLVGTGAYIKIYVPNDEEPSDSNYIPLGESRMVLYGDVTGDGKMNVADALAIVKNKLGKKVFENEYFIEAGRVTKQTRNKQSTPGVADALSIVKQSLKKVKIEQYYE